MSSDVSAFRGLHPHHRYQLQVVLLFILGFFLFFAYSLIIDRQGFDMATYQWYFTLPWTTLYALWCLLRRARVPRRERVSPLRRPIIHWVVLGIALIAYQLQPIDLKRFYSFDLTFAVFTIFLADSYWDFI